jgi:uncharacterized membrane protein YraQ (UPF0718 family)
MRDLFCGWLFAFLIGNAIADFIVEYKMKVRIFELENRVAAIERIEVEHKNAINALERKLWIEVMNQ